MKKGDQIKEKSSGNTGTIVSLEVNQSLMTDDLAVTIVVAFDNMDSGAEHTLCMLGKRGLDRVEVLPQ